MLYVGEGPRGSNGACSTLCWISVTPSTTHNQTGPLWCWFPSGWACARSRPLWVSPTNSPVRLGVCRAAASTPTGVFNQRFEALFPCTGAPGWAVCFAPLWFLPVYLCGNVGPQGLPAPTLWGVLVAAWLALFHNPPPSCVLQLPPCHWSSPPGCLSLPLPVVWMNVFSLSPWLSDFHTVWFSVSSGCCLFLNCCCPSFGCVRRHSVSTYASILARSQELTFLTSVPGVQVKLENHWSKLPSVPHFQIVSETIFLSPLCSNT